MRHPLSTVFAISLLSASLVAALGQSEKQKSFEAAASEERGCVTIPYSELQSQCVDQQKGVNEACNGRNGPVKCTLQVTESLKGRIVTTERRTEELKRERQELDSQRDHANDQGQKDRIKEQIDEKDKQIEASNRQSEDLKRALSDRKDQIDKTIDRINQCISYRQAVMNIFETSLDKVRNDGDRDAELRPSAEKLKTKYQGEKETHKGEIDGKARAIDDCKAERP